MDCRSPIENWFDTESELEIDLNHSPKEKLFELVGTADIIDPNHQYVEVDFEGFYLEVTLAMITESLMEFKSHFAGRQIRRYEQLTQLVIDTIFRASQLIKFQQYQVNIQNHQSQINALIQEEPLIIPVGYEGHAITFIKFQHILVKCDRREDSRLYDNIVFYQINRPHIITADFIKTLIYEKQSSEFINQQLPVLLDLKPVTEIKITAQISGNCSWANVEACIPSLYFILFSNFEDFETNTLRYKNLSLDFFNQWRDWNKDRALNFCIQSFNSSDSIRKACKAELLTAILFQCSLNLTEKNRERAEKIITLLMSSSYSYMLQNYIRIYCYGSQNKEGENFLKLLKSYGYLDIG